jgi:2-oxoglutarate ferredoxin oxidoreductase subunit beta
MATTLDELRSPIGPTWCPGCGNFSILTVIKQSIVDLGWNLEDVVFVFGIGCSGNMADFLRGYGLHGLHGRGIANAAGIKMANHRLHVIMIGGDGDIYGEGLNHFVAACRANHDLTVLIHDNQRYSLTTGQAAPTTAQGTKTKSTPAGVIEEAINPLALAITADAGLVARAYAGNLQEMKSIVQTALQHPGFSVVDILQPCPTFNVEHSYEWYQQNIQALPADYSATDRGQALLRALDESHFQVGVYYQNNRPAYHQEIAWLKEKTLLEQFPKQVNLSAALTGFL